jgi:hypothetical protein
MIILLTNYNSIVKFKIINSLPVLININLPISIVGMAQELISPLSAASSGILCIPMLSEIEIQAAYSLPSPSPTSSSSLLSSAIK